MESVFRKNFKGWFRKSVATFMSFVVGKQVMMKKKRKKDEDEDDVDDDDDHDDEDD